ncbi:MAG: metal-dependent transcriptional regulator [Candidatus Gastranaerophilales bacterium]|nr:metal-dependent transcriptional regulator [Candidatus Gastranaerophilales bacterium]
MVSNQTKKKISASLEDYLEAIYLIIEEKQAVKAVEVARFLNVGRSSVTEALKSLASKGLVNYGRYDVLTLTKDGEKIAKKVIKKHKILYNFFKNILNLNDEEANQNACQIEHIISEDAFNRFTKYIEFNETFAEDNEEYCKNLKEFLEK